LGKRWRGLIGVFGDGILASVFCGLILVVIALDDGGGGLLLVVFGLLLLLVSFALLLRGVGGVRAEDLGVGSWRGAGSGGEIGVGGIGIATGRRGAIVNGLGVCGAGRAIFATHKAEGK
jgi:hypothetical protein